MAIELPKKKVTISVGQPGNLAKSEDQTLTLKELAELLEKPLTTSEKFHQYKDGSHAYKQGRKASAGWFIRCPVEGGIRNRKSVGSSHVITFDMDDVPPKYVQKIRDGKALSDYAMIVHSTRSHTPEEPRLRLMLFVDDAIPPEEYNRVSRIVGVMIDKKLKHIDPVSFRPAQMMFRPSVSRDMEKHYVFHTQNGALLDWEDEVRRWEKETGLDSQDITNLPTAPGENKLRESAEKAEDPLTKEGAVGDFCRAWSITELVQGKEDENGNHHEGPLKDVYQIDDWENGNAARMTYLGGHSTNGAVVYEDKFVYSHHGSDPASDALLNAYDLVRVHKFGDRDDKIADDAPMKDRPSVKGKLPPRAV